MKSDIDLIMDLMSRYTPKSETEEELGEQDAAATGGGGTKPKYPTVTKWESGVTRGLANQIGLTKWRDIIKISRGKANTLL
jgi:hypothetical protein